MQKVLVTGATGFLGKYMVQELSQHYLVHTLSRHATADLIVDLGQQVPALKDHYDLVVHAAGKAHILEANEMDAATYFQVNTNGTSRLCEAFDRLGAYPKALVFTSSVSVYGLESGELISETQPLHGISAYGNSKIEAELLLSDWCAKHSVTLSILRLPLVAGANPPGNLGAMIEAIKRNRYFNINGGDARKSMVMAADVAKWIPAIAATGGTYHLTDGYHPSFSELAALISKELGKNPPMSIPHWLALPLAFAGNYLGNKAPINNTQLRKIGATLTFDDSRARNTFGWNPGRVLDQFTIN